ncbi:zinc finger C2HC domain-containing protein T03G11.3-like [Cimex lectularius]|uniref:C2HC/C3H-type domain-containing protein n=1 Tax=Cimex lectularius TaxID=79782 RepID=A0A8I6TN17_CIMLE|nr:zinc finger C2HC domain-containing protein T03G11.3-like [Cimex lectularius]XP_014239459.1 zinc finger C2HC domain-containing protein T03G11.3-like [Cimex lectularius]XP_014239460.1 zinc finger C2HC domain-containing protein T03G11.3-like [Cimex lectularius]XP_014239461.1 zinc finger C2HC domain-containing protein T03G11.3-like [Cimex lectularius]XP_024086223.1 zinc finger C2HC domain-containing protein T03G11.3-like [Cimex lectularius]XP_024086224.1 zinc finger C2HC domain-containing prote
MEAGNRVSVGSGTTPRTEGYERIPCPTCKRKFIEESYNKHIDICKNHAKRASERTSFDSSKQRLSQLLDEVKLSNQTLPPRLYNVKWRQEHSLWMSSRNGLLKKKPAGHSAAAEARADSSGGTLCMGCERMVYGNDANDHIAFCVEKNKRK